ncbi:MAG: hypothetical protein IPK16_29845 [Anaerolineales bacterium]|nr:hypothetical protein [Anaerolineales bacterium]
MTSRVIASMVTSRHPDQLLVVDPVYAQIMMTETTGLQTLGVVVNEATGRIYVGNFGSGDVWVYDSRTLTVLAKIPIGVNPTLLEILPDEDTVFAIARQESRIVVIKGLTKAHRVWRFRSPRAGCRSREQTGLRQQRDSAHLATISKQAAGGWKAHSNLVFEDGRQLFGLVYHPDNGYVYSIYAMPDNTWYIDAWKPNNSALWGREATIVVPSGGALDSELVGGTGIVVSPKTGHVLNANTGADSVTVIDANTNRVSETIVVGDPFPVVVKSV